MWWQVAGCSADTQRPRLDLYYTDMVQYSLLGTTILSGWNKSYQTIKTRSLNHILGKTKAKLCFTSISYELGHLNQFPKWTSIINVAKIKYRFNFLKILFRRKYFTSLPSLFGLYLHNEWSLEPFKRHFSKLFRCNVLPFTANAAVVSWKVSQVLRSTGPG